MHTVLSENHKSNNLITAFLYKHQRAARFILLLLLFCIFIPAFTVSTYALYKGYQRSSNALSLGSPSIQRTPTPTPFQPLDPTPTYLPTAIPTERPNDKPHKEDDTTEINGQTGTIKESDDLINILVLGSDQRPDEGGFRTDTIILMSLNTADKTISMVSFPRDLYISIPGWSYQRINTAMSFGGFDLIAQTLEYNFGIKPDYYVMANFDVFQKVIDKLGGIEVEAASTFKDIYLDGNYKRIPAGTVHMNGATALWYARSRQTSNDFDRARRQQEVLHAVIKRAIRTDVLENAKELYDIYVDNVETNLSWSEVASLISLSIHLKNPSQIQRFVIGPDEVYDWITPNGAMVLVPYPDKIKNLLNDVIGD
jgi:LCP family protein required for cell wall assembly